VRVGLSTRLPVCEIPNPRLGPEPRVGLLGAVSSRHGMILMAAVEKVPDDFPAERYSSFTVCEDCGHSAPFDLVGIPAGGTMNRIKALLRCSDCGSRSVGRGLFIPEWADSGITGIVGIDDAGQVATCEWIASAVVFFVLGNATGGYHRSLADCARRPQHVTVSAHDRSQAAQRAVTESSQFGGRGLEAVVVIGFATTGLSPDMGDGETEIAAVPVRSPRAGRCRDGSASAVAPRADIDRALRACRGYA
jgi:hypothetical protein